MSETRFRFSGRLLVGLVLIALGVLHLLDNFGFVDAERYLWLWPSLIILWGLLQLFGIGTRTRRVLPEGVQPRHRDDRQREQVERRVAGDGERAEDKSSDEC